MNMKKTIAAIAAGAVAVSAMATSVSAFTEHTLHYNLVKTSYGVGTGSVTLYYRISDIGVWNDTANHTITFQDTNATKILKLDGTVTFTITGTKANSYYTFTTTATNSKDSENYSAAVTAAAGEATLNVGAIVPTGLQDNTELVVSMTVKHNSTDTGSNISYINNAISGGTINMDTVGLGWNPVTPATADLVDIQPQAKSFTAPSETVTKSPLRTILNATTGSTEIIDYLGTPGNNLTSKGNSYYNVVAVLNDAISNYDDITFVFNTATGNVIDTEWYNANSWIGANTLIGTYHDWAGTGKYKSFGSQIYNLYGDEASTYTGYINYNFYNLFAAGLVVNDAYSMSLSDVNTFTYGASAISFNWDDIMTTNSGSTINPVLTYLRTMRLATSVEWYWDSIDVVLANVEVDTVDTTAPATSDDDVIDDEEIDDEVIDFVEDEEEFVEDEEEFEEDFEEDIEEDIEEDVEEEEAPVVVVEDTTPAPAPANNPKTGNASVALAVIPVALAAAAIVAKKRG